MKKLIAVTIITIILLITVITNATAESKKQNVEINKKIETTTATITPGIKIINKEEDDKTITQIKVKGIGKDHSKWKGFEMKGNISTVTPTSAVTPTSFKLNGNTINMDATVTGKIQINGTIKASLSVKVEGKIIDGDYYAKEIKVENSKGSEEDENKIENDDQISSTVTSDISVTPTPNSTPTGTVQKTGDQYKISVVGNLLDIIKALEDLLSKLKLQV